MLIDTRVLIPAGSTCVIARLLCMHEVMFHKCMVTCKVHLLFHIKAWVKVVFHFLLNLICLCAVLGLLLSVVNLETDSNASSITVSWTAPFSLDMTGVDHDIWYSILIYNVTDKENPTATPCTDCHNLTQTQYIFSPDYSSPRHKYTFTVIPYNGAGKEESSQNVTGREFLRILYVKLPVRNARRQKIIGVLGY